jgi:hypothetical protein
MKNLINIDNELISNSSLYKTNVKIHKNLWKFYSLALSFSVIFILIKGIN